MVIVMLGVALLLTLLALALRSLFGKKMRPRRISEIEARENGKPLTSAIISVAPRTSPHRAHRGF